MTHREHSFTQLNTNITEVLMEIQEDLELCWLAKMKNPSHKRDQQKYCEFHADHSYETKECVVLRLQIEKLINNGKLTRFLGD